MSVVVRSAIVGRWQARGFASSATITIARTQWGWLAVSEGERNQDGEYLRFDPEESTDEWGTPRELWRPIDRVVGGFDLDPCSGAETAEIADTTLSKDDDGLSTPWFGSVWVNPPYSDIRPWARKCVAEAARDDVDTIVLLLPVRTSTQWFHDHVLEANVIVLVEGRLSFLNPHKQPLTAPFASLLAVFGPLSDELITVLDEWGAIFSSQDRIQQTKQTQLTVYV